mmetsp:Transcript_29925/g.60724  ORF Transcript_29925/g.60724 Transcript_29925/m.60724 type:complete len:332 (-) Transcript_29925:928-1923(-)
MSATFDKYEEHFVALTAKAGRSLALVDNCGTGGNDGSTDNGSSEGNSDSGGNNSMSNMEHVQVASMLLGQASDLVDAMEVEWRLFCKTSKRMGIAIGGRQQINEEANDMRRRLDGCSDLCTALRAECRVVRKRVRDAEDVTERTEEISFEENGNDGEGTDSANAFRGKAVANGGGSTRRKVKQWTCDKCKVAKFADYDEACKHEESCDGTAPPPPAEDELSFSSRNRKKDKNKNSSNRAKGRSSAANAYRSSLFEKAEATTATLENQNATLENARRVMADTEATAGTITEELARNRESIESASGHVGELHGMTNSARRTIKTMQRRKKYLF